MIPVKKQPEPADFDVLVRQRGLAHLTAKGLALDQPLPRGTKIEPYWVDCLDDLYQSYQGTCAYLAVFFERVVGGASTDHFIAKSSTPSLAYEWTNYRLACSTMNSRKRTYDDVLDPFALQEGWFHLELVTGRIYPAPGLPAGSAREVDATIARLGLDDPGVREMRARHYQEYRQGYYSRDYFERKSPFVYGEALRQGLL